jgi:hypothetical protein
MAKVQKKRNITKDREFKDVGFDIEQYAYKLWGENVMCIPGMSKNALLRLVSELGADFVEKFRDTGHFSSWEY